MKRKVRLLIKISFNTTAIEMAKVSRAPSPGNPYAFLFRNQRAGVVQTKYLALRCVLFYLFSQMNPLFCYPKKTLASLCVRHWIWALDGAVVCSPLCKTIHQNISNTRILTTVNFTIEWMLMKTLLKIIISECLYRENIRHSVATTGTRPIINTSHHLLPCLIWSVADYSICVLCSHFNGICFYKLYPDIIILIRV